MSCSIRQFSRSRHGAEEREAARQASLRAAMAGISVGTRETLGDKIHTSIFGFFLGQALERECSGDCIQYVLYVLNTDSQVPFTSTRFVMPMDQTES